MKSKLISLSKFRFFTLFMIMCLLGASMIAPVQAQQNNASVPGSGGPLKPKVSSATHVAESGPLGDIPALSPEDLAKRLKIEPQGINKPIPRPGRSTRGPDPSFKYTAPIKASPAPLPPSSLTAVRSFDGLNAADDAATINATYAPPDTDGAVGPNHYVQMVNSIYAVYDKATGAVLGGPYANNALWVDADTNDACELQNDGDPVVLYDQLADRWLLSQFALPNYPDGPFYECIAISSTADPLGTWHLYNFKISDTKMDDYPKLGVWPDGYYMSVNQFDTVGWAGTGVAAFERSEMLNGDPADMVYFDNASDDIGGLLPSHLQGSTVPPTNEPNYFVQASDEAWGYTATDLLRVWAFHVDWATPANSTFTSLGDLNTNAFDTDMCNYSRDCIAQPGTTQKVDAISDRLMYLLNYRNFTTYQTMVVNHTVDVGSDHAGVRWYELRNTGSGWSIYQQGDYAPDSDQRWMGSMSMDGEGNIALGYSVSSSSTYPSVRFTGRLDGDTLGVMTQDENSIVEGTGSQLGVNRWGDYSAMLIDPVDDCTFWYTQEYVKDTGAWNWATRIGAFKIPSCGTAWGSLSGTVDDGTNPVAGAVVEITGGAAVSTDVNGDYSFPGLPAGSYSATVTKYGYGLGSASGLTITNGNPTIQNFSLTAKTMATVSGVVTDAGTGAPLAADIYIPEYPNSPVAANPTTGAYSVQLEYGTDHHFTVVATGYVNATATINPASPTITQDFPLNVDIAACTAPGYKRVSGFSQNFNAAFPPAGWGVVDKAGNGVVWDLSSSWLDGNYTDGTGDASDANSDAAGLVDFDTILTSPLINVADLPGKYLTYKANYQNYGGLDFLKLDIQVDNGAWTTILNWNEDHGSLYNTPGEGVTLNLSSRLSGHSNFKLRWHYFDPTLGGDWDWYAQIDDVAIGDCVLTQTDSFQSSSTYDGWVRESSETSNVGGAVNTTSNLLYVGDDALDKQYKSLVSFNTTSLPDGAFVSGVQLKFKVQGFEGGNMFTPTKTLGNMLVDISKPYFGTGASLITADFQAVANQSSVGALSTASAPGWYTVTLKSSSFQFVSLNGTTQLRLRFAKDDNDDLGADYLKIFSSDAPSGSRPILIVEYFVP